MSGLRARSEKTLISVQVNKNPMLVLFAKGVKGTAQQKLLHPLNFAPRL